MMERLTFGGFLVRLICSLLLVGLTWNPSTANYVSWIRGSFPQLDPMQVVIGLILLAGWVFSVHATWRSLGQFGVLLGAAIFGAIVWLLASYGWLDLSKSKVLWWLVVTLFGVLMAVGLSWSLLQRRVTGQVDVEDAHGR